MRISDWSSDVCSSDIFGAADVRGRYHQVQRDRVRCCDEVGDAPVRSVGYRSNRAIAVQAEEGHGSREHARALVLALVEELARRRGHHGMDDGRVCAAEMVGRHHPAESGDERALRIGQEGRDPRERLFFLCRSEEHTSELQSLMRISYAVFCLKKNTTNTKQNT